jgi:hypothetical protein
MITHKPISQIIAENQLFTPRGAIFMAHLDAFHRIVRNSRSEQEEGKVVAEMPRGIRISGKMSDEEIRVFFSFLYKETSAGGMPFLTKEVFDIVFVHGLTIPLVPLTKKYKINCSLACPRKIVDMAIHLFIQKHSGGKKAQILKFLGSYFEEYSDALVSPRKLEMLASNINGEKSPRNKIDFEKYLPKRYRESQKTTSYI